MPPPNRRHDPSPEELARQIAAQLARTKPSAPRFSFRGSVLLGRLLAGFAAVAAITLVGVGVVAGANWLLAGDTDRQPEVLAKTVTLDDDGGTAATDVTTTTRLDGTFLPLLPLMFPPPSTDTADRSGPTTILPAASTTTTSNPVVSTSIPTTTTVPGTTSFPPSTAPTTTRAPTTTTVPAPTTMPPNTTTTLPPNTTTTVPPTTTTVAPTTTTTAPATTTTTEATTTTSTTPSPPSTPGRG